MEQYKSCSKCNQSKPASDFHKYIRSNDGLKPACKDCNKCEAKKWRENNLDKAKLTNKRWAENNKEASYLIKKRWQQNNKEKVSASTRKWQLANAEHIKLVSQIWASNNKDLRLQTAARRRARKAENGIFYISPKDLRKLRNQICFYCRRNPGSEIDHVIPISRGGTHGIGNLVLACRACNRSKSSKYVTEWKYAR